MPKVGYWKFNIGYWNLVFNKFQYSIPNTQYPIKSDGAFPLRGNGKGASVQGQRISPPIDFEKRYSLSKRIIFP